MKKQGVEIIEIFSGTLWEAGMIKSQLENHGIAAFLKDEIIGTLSPWWTASGGVGSVKVTISASDYEKAILIVERFIKLQRE